MNNMKLIGCLFLLSWLLTATSVLSSAVIDTAGHPLMHGQEYYIKPAITDSGGRFTLLNRTGSCPLYVGQENTDLPAGLPVTFSPFTAEDKVVRVNRDFTVAFAAATICAESTEWEVGDVDRESGRRRLIVGSSSNGSNGKYRKYFRIVETKYKGIYNIEWCPTDLCNYCRFKCGSVGGLRENQNIFLALDAKTVLPVVFQKP